MPYANELGHNPFVKRGPKGDLEKRRKATELFLCGLTYREIGEKLGISRQRAQQLIRPPADVYEAVKSRAGGRCEGCGVALSAGHIHHIKSRDILDDFNDAPNLRYFCLACHRMAHSEDYAAYSKKADVYWNADNNEFVAKCKCCGSMYKYSSLSQIYCSARCRRRFNQRKVSRKAEVRKYLENPLTFARTRASICLATAKHRAKA